jgi:hypothetical protein
MVPFYDSLTSSCAHNMGIQSKKDWIRHWSHDPHNTKSCPAVLFKLTMIMAPVDPAGPDCYQSGTKPCEST